MPWERDVATEAGVGEGGVFLDDTQLLTWCSESSSNVGEQCVRGRRLANE